MGYQVRRITKNGNLGSRLCNHDHGNDAESALECAKSFQSQLGHDVPTIHYVKNRRNKWSTRQLQ